MELINVDNPTAGSGRRNARIKWINQRRQNPWPFGHLKRIMKLDRLRLRGMSGAHDEFLLAATPLDPRKQEIDRSHNLAALGAQSSNVLAYRLQRNPCDLLC